MTLTNEKPSHFTKTQIFIKELHALKSIIGYQNRERDQRSREWNERRGRAGVFSPRVGGGGSPSVRQRWRIQTESPMAAAVSVPPGSDSGGFNRPMSPIGMVSVGRGPSELCPQTLLPVAHPLGSPPLSQHAAPILNPRLHETPYRTCRFLNSRLAHSTSCSAFRRTSHIRTH